MSEELRMSLRGTRYRSGGEEMIRYYPENDGETFSGDGHEFVNLNSDGRIVEVTSATYAAPPSHLVGIPLKPASNLAADSTTKNIPVRVLTTDMELELPVYHPTSLLAVTSHLLVGAWTSLHYDSTYELWMVDIQYARLPGSAFVDGDAVMHCVITEISDRYPVGEKYGTVFVRFPGYYNKASGGTATLDLNPPFLVG